VGAFVPFSIALCQSQLDEKVVRALWDGYAPSLGEWTNVLVCQLAQQVGTALTLCPVRALCEVRTHVYLGFGCLAEMYTRD